MNAVEEEVLKRIVPSPEVVASIKDRADRLKEMVESYVASHGIDAEARFTGSYSKNTYLSDPDLDLFLLFPPETDPEDLKRIGLKAGEDILHGMRMYSDHPYTRGVFEGLDVDMVPCFHIDSTEHMKSAVDRTPFHTAFVKSRLDDDGCNQVRLLKKFMKGIGAYGAEQDSRGFSGYLCEILVVKYRTFDNVLRAASKWRNGTVIDVNGKGPKMSSALVIYDPVDNKRNAASAVHVDTLSLFITAAREYLEEPRMEFFFPNRREPLSRIRLTEAAEAHGTELISVTFDKPSGMIDDNLQSQLWKTQYALQKKLDEHSFNVIRAVHEMGGLQRIPRQMERQPLRRAVHRGRHMDRHGSEAVHRRRGHDLQGGLRVRDRQGAGRLDHEGPGTRRHDRRCRPTAPDGAPGPQAALGGLTSF